MIYLAIVLSGVLFSIPAIRALRRVRNHNQWHEYIVGRRGMPVARNYGERR